MDSPSRSELAGTITRLVRRLPERQPSVSQALFEFLMSRLSQVARKRLATAQRRVEDEEDLLGEVIGEFLMAGEQGQLPPLKSREDVLKMLSRRLQQRAANMHRDQNAEVRGGGHVRGDSAVGRGQGSGERVGFDNLAGDSPRPEDRLLRADDLREIYREIERTLNDEALFRVYTLWGSGLTKEQIGEAIQLSPSSVYRKLAMILDRLRQAYPQAPLPDRL